MKGRSFYKLQPCSNGRWLVGHSIPGLTQGLAVDTDCPNLDAAVSEARRLEEERQRRLIRAAQERELLSRVGAWR